MPDTITTTQYEDAYRTGFRRIEAILRKLGANPDLAEDLTQEAFGSSGWTKRYQLKDPGRVIEWVTSIAVNRLKSEAAKGRRVMRLSDAGPNEPKIAPSVNATLISLRTALTRLPKRQRVLIEAVYLEGRTAGEMAGRLGISLNAAQQRLTRCRQTLRRALGEV